MGSDFFADKKYQQMDWISQAVSPWDFELVAILAALPETINVTPELMLKSTNFEYGYLDTDQIISLIAQSMGYELENYPTHIFPWNSIFKLNTDDVAKVDFESMTMDHIITLTKTKQTFDDKDCNACAARVMREKMGYNFDMNQSDVNRAGEILDLLGVNPGSCRGLRNRHRMLRSTMIDILEQDQWRLRSMNLVDKLGHWIIDYVTKGQLSSLANFAKLKVMTHSGQPIYSMAEVE